jgi:very-short-patch-repair endonuclease
VPSENALEDAIRPKLPSRELDRLIAQFAERRHGRVARWQLLAAGACARAIGRRIERGLLRITHRGVYVVGHRVQTEKGQVLGAVLAAGDGAVASHITAARLWELPIGPATPVHVTTSRHRHSSAEITFHRARLPADERTEVHGVPVTTAARTLFDIAGWAPRHRLRALVNEAEYRQLTDVIALPQLVERYPGRRGVAVLRGILAEARLGDRTKEELEARFREFLIERDLRQPHFNWPITLGAKRIVADCVWPDRRLILELDGRAAHDRRRNFDADRARDRALAVAGWRVIRVTWLHLHDQADELERELRELTEGAIEDG